MWEATLLYSQVDKAFKEDELGEEARFKNAHLSFYMGDFPWSQAQLDVLKGSTSELVANDALALSVFMTDNMGLDTSTVPMEMYSRADLLIFQNKFDAAIQTLDSITASFPKIRLLMMCCSPKEEFISQRKIIPKQQLSSNRLTKITPLTSWLMMHFFSWLNSMRVTSTTKRRQWNCIRTSC